MSLFRTLAPLVARPQQLSRVNFAAASQQHRWSGSLAAGAEGEEGEFAPELAEVAFESSEPTFMTTLTFSEKGVQAMLKEDIDREKVRDVPAHTHARTHTHAHTHAAILETTPTGGPHTQQQQHQQQKEVSQREIKTRKKRNESFNPNPRRPIYTSRHTLHAVGAPTITNPTLR